MWCFSVIEMLQVILGQHALPGCLALNASNLLVQESLLFVRLLEKHLAGSPLLAPVGQGESANPVKDVSVSRHASPMFELSKTDELGLQCLAGTYTELGLNAAALESLSCFEHWKHRNTSKGHQGELRSRGLSVALAQGVFVAPTTEDSGERFGGRLHAAYTPHAQSYALALRATCIAAKLKKSENCEWEGTRCRTRIKLCWVV